MPSIVASVCQKEARFHRKVVAAARKAAAAVRREKDESQNELI
jgi:hypothetical protein